MRNSKEQTVAANIEAFLAGRTEEYRQKFTAKDLHKQYLSIVNWKRRQEQKVGNVLPAASTELTKTIRKVRKTIETGAELSEAEIKKISAELATVQDSLKNYAAIRAQREIAELEKGKAKADARIALLRQEHQL